MIGCLSQTVGPERPCWNTFGQGRTDMIEILDWLRLFRSPGTIPSWNENGHQAPSHSPVRIKMVARYHPLPVGKNYHQAPSPVGKNYHQAPSPVGIRCQFRRLEGVALLSWVCPLPLAHSVPRTECNIMWSIWTRFNPNPIIGYPCH